MIDDLNFKMPLILAIFIFMSNLNFIQAEFRMKKLYNFLAR